MKNSHEMVGIGTATDQRLRGAGRHIIIESPRRALLLEQQQPSPGDDEIVVCNDATLVSPGTELALFEGTHAGLPDPEVPFAKYPFFPGYAALGQVVATGARVRTPVVGQRIFHFGRHARFSCLRPDETVWIEAPLDLAPAHVLLLRLVQISATATYVWRRRPSRVLVLGAGLVGILAAQVCRIKGVAEIAIQDINPSRLALAARCGISNGLLAKDDVVPASSEAFGGAAPDCIIEATGVAALVPAALRGVQRGGDVILLGSPRSGVHLDLYKHIHHKGAALIGAHETLLPGRSIDGSPSRQSVVQESLDWLRSGALKLDGLVSHTIKPDQLPDAYVHMAADKTGTLGVVVEWT